MRRPRLAVVRQCTRRSDSPTSWSRTPASSSPALAREHVARTVPEREWTRTRSAQLNEPRLDPEEAGGVQAGARADEAERILQHELGGQAVAPAFRTVDVPAADETTRNMPQRGRRVAESLAALDDRRRHEAQRRLDEDRGLDRVTLGRVRGKPPHEPHLAATRAHGR